jgi:CRP-like cAMP-binding protein
MFVIVSGRYRLEETGIEIEPGNVVGELSLLAPKHRRTQTLECLEPGTVFRMNLKQLEQLFFQNQKFGFYFLKLVTSRMTENLERLECTLAEREQALRQLRKADAGVSEPMHIANAG